MAEQTKIPTGAMPVGNRIDLMIQPDQVEITSGDRKAPEFDDDATATIVYEDFEKARAYLETNSWLLNWQETDILYQSPQYDRNVRTETGRPARISRFIVAKNTNTMVRQEKKSLFAEQLPFTLRATNIDDEEHIEAWTILLSKLLKRSEFNYHGRLVADCQGLQGTGICKWGWEERTVVKKKRQRKNPPTQIEQPLIGPQTINTVESDEFMTVPVEEKQSYPFFEFRRLGTTLFDPKWKTPNRPDLCGYAIDVDYVTVRELMRMRELECYKNIPDEEALKEWIMRAQFGDAPSPGQVADTQTAQGSAVTHAEGEYRDMSADPFEKPILLLEKWAPDRVSAILCYEGQKLTIRNEEHEFGRTPHGSANWWNIPNSGYGIGVGWLTSPDQRINQGVTNEALKMIGFPMNAPVLIRRGENTPTQNIVTSFGRFWQVDTGPDGDVRKAASFLQVPPVPADAWKFIMDSVQNAEDVSGANSSFAQGNLTGPRSSAARTATGAGRIAEMSDANLSDPVDAYAEGVIVPFIEFLMEMVKERMPLAEIRQILKEKLAKDIIAEIDFEQFLNVEFEVDVLAGQKLALRAALAQVIPFFEQIVQQPQILEYLHQRGETIDFKAMLQVYLQMSALNMQPDVFRPLTPQEQQTVQQMNPNAAKAQQAIAVEKLRGQNKIQEVQAKGQMDLATKAAETAMEHYSGGAALERAEGMSMRKHDQDILENGL